MLTVCVPAERKTLDDKESQQVERQYGHHNLFSVKFLLTPLRDILMLFLSQKGNKMRTATSYVPELAILNSYSASPSSPRVAELEDRMTPSE